MKRRRHQAAVFLLTALAALTGAAKAPDQQVPLEPPSDNVRFVMTEIEPFISRNGVNPEGFYAEIWERAARDLDVSYETIWVDSFDELLPTVESGNADIAVAR